eukprot:6050-Heterococcus_DN1.PRE.7
MMHSQLQACAQHRSDECGANIRKLYLIPWHVDRCTYSDDGIGVSFQQLMLYHKSHVMLRCPVWTLALMQAAVLARDCTMILHSPHRHRIPHTRLAT